ncbi:MULTISPECIES: heme ABC transporter ATP-binding protein [Marinobacter]|uniref:heme ABC transporter ATP-binding protein n=1 Tax=Marinobacter TaxID=2742 RepID=UPI000DABC9A5|nr:MULTISPECIES: heme ABC transporter ATP-binding protein [Marinobacter]
MSDITPSAPTPALLQLSGVSVALGGHPILDDISLQVAAGEMVALLGPNGAGKSTLIRTLAGELSASAAGQVGFGDRPLGRWHRKELARHRAVMPQKVDLQFPMTVEEVVALGRPREPQARRSAVMAELLDWLDIAHLRTRLVPTLSGGEQQRTQLARVMAQVWDQPRPRLLLLDECSSALDPAHQQLVFQRLRGMANAGAGLLVAVHDLNLAAQFADRLVLMKNGRLFAEGTPESVLTSANLYDVYGLSARVERLAEGYPMVIPLTEPATGASEPSPAPIRPAASLPR